MNWAKVYPGTSNVQSFLNLSTCTRLTAWTDSSTGEWTILASTAAGELRLAYTFATKAEADAEIVILVGAL